MFGELLKRHRLTAGFTQEGLAEAAALSREAISALERGGRQFPRNDTVELIANALQLAAKDRTALYAAAARPSVARRVEGVEARRPPGADSTLPVPLTPLVGRDGELSYARGRDGELSYARGRLVRDRVRLLTITGPAGVGKSRLALELAHACRAAFADGAVMVDLASARSRDQLGEAVARALGMPDPSPGERCEGIVEHLRDKNLLLVLDNFEHLLGEAVVMVDCLASCPGVRVVVTSRGILRVRGEELLAVSPMFVPHSDSGMSLEQLAQTPAVALFVARAQAVRPDFSLTASNADDVRAICRRLDGLPLALELAAARIRLLSPAALLRRLERRLPALTDGALDLPERHRTLRAALAWSYELLTPGDQALFRCLSVFERGATLEEISGVWQLMLGDVSASDDGTLLDSLAALADRGLVRQEETGQAEPRFVMLETVREYGLELLDATAEVHAVVRACTNYYLPRLDAGETEPWWPMPQLPSRGAVDPRCLSQADVFALVG